MVNKPDIKCLDCGVPWTGENLIKDGWRYIKMVEDEDPTNGWRCPKCVFNYDTMFDDTTGTTH